MRTSSFGAVLSAVAIVAGSPAQAQMPTQASRPQIVTSGEGEVRIVPDRATIIIGVQTRAPTAAAAASDNARRQRAIVDTIRALGVAPNLISTTGYNVYPETQYDRDTQRSRVTAYVVSNNVRAEVLRLDQVGALVDAALTKGANQINSLSFYSSKADSARRSALADAVSKARADAEVMARAAGGSLGDLLELSEAGVSQPVPMVAGGMARMAVAGAPPTPVEAGELTVHASVSARWLFVPGVR